MYYSEEIILDKVTPFVNNNALSYDEFDSLFAALPRKEQYSILNVLAAHHIELRPADDEDMVRAYVTEFTEDASEEAPQVLKIIKKETPMSNELLAKAYQENHPEALEELCVRNKRLVMDCVRRYARMSGNDLNDDDLYAAGVCGLIKAAQRFNYSLGNRFSTYACWWIQQAVVREIEDHSRIIRIPVHMQERIRMITRMEYDLAQQGFTFEECVDEIVEALKYSSRPLTKEQVIKCVQLREQTSGCSSLDKPVGEDDETPLLDFIPADKKNNPEVQLTITALRSELMDRIRELDFREQMIILKRFGMDGQGKRTLEEIAKVIHLSRERVRQIENRALRKLKGKCGKAHMKDYLEDIAQWA